MLEAPRLATGNRQLSSGAALGLRVRFGQRFQVGKADLVLRTDHLLHAAEESEDLGEVVAAAVHGPADVSGSTAGLQLELHIVVAREGLQEVKVDLDER